MHTLNLGANPLRNDGAKAQAKHAGPRWPQMPNLKLCASGLEADGVAAVAKHAAQHWPMLQTLDLSGNKLGDVGITKLVQHAQHWPQLRSINLSMCQLGSDGVKALAQHADRYWPQLQSMSLDHNALFLEELIPAISPSMLLLKLKLARDWPRVAAVMKFDLEWAAECEAEQSKSV
jgi:Ran GTPase-activating protein (RanGAP) involved in mRNA processing and transport